MTEKEFIFSQTRGGLDVFIHYFGDVVNKKFCNKFRHDVHPSCKIKCKKGRYYMVDCGAPAWNGSCFHLVAMIYNLNMRFHMHEMVRIICEELELEIPDDALDESPMSDSMLQTRVYCGYYKRFEASFKPFGHVEKKYWARYGITPGILDKYNVHLIEQCHLEENSSRHTIISRSSEPAFGFVFNDGKGIKIFRPKSSARFFLAGDIPKPYVFGMEQLPDTGIAVYIVGDESDVMCFAAQGLSAVCLCNNSSILPASITLELLERFNYLVFLCDGDQDRTRMFNLHARKMREKGYDNVISISLPLSGIAADRTVCDYFRNGASVEDIEHLTKQSIKASLEQHGQ